MTMGWDDAELAGLASGSGSPGLIGKLYKSKTKNDDLFLGTWNSIFRRG